MREAVLHVLRVFVGPNGRGGNPLGVFLDGAGVPADARQSVAADLGFSETVFVLDRAAGLVEIFTPVVRLPFAGHPLVGASWLLAATGSPVEALRPPAGRVATWADPAGQYWIRGRAEWAPEMELRQYPAATDVDALAGAPDGLGFVDAWAWADEPAGRVRSRVFAPAVGVTEDEATGAAAVRLVTLLGRPLVIEQGTGSRIHARPGPDGSAEVGGDVVLEERRSYRLDG
jgi:predicted PhzF superfamily epimerase YddE/YHI9